MHMKTSSHSAVFSSILLLCALICATGVSAQTAANPGQPAQPGQYMQVAPAAGVPGPAPSACGNQPLCYDTQDFTATITSFLTSNRSNYKIIDVAIRFQNKTNQSMVLGYRSESGVATDDRGNRSVVWGSNGYRGIGLVAGSNFDPKFVLRPGGYGDAQFELLLQGWPQLIGFNYVLDLTIAEINTFEGNQHTLGGEFPLHFQGLANGAGGVSPGYSNGMGGGSAVFANGASQTPCGASGAVAAVAGAANGTGSQTASNAANRVATAASTISSLGSLFGRKKQADPNAAAAAASPCVPSAVAAPGIVPAPVTGGVASAVPAVSSTPAAATANRASNAATNANATRAHLPTTASSATVVKTTATTANTPAATSAVAKVPVATAKPAATAAAPAATAAKPAAAVVPATKKPPLAKPDPKKPAQQ
jgi:hypothetical protein